MALTVAMFSTANFSGALKYWYMGRFHEWAEGPMHPMMHALHYGTSAFEGIRAYATPAGPAIFRLPEHIARLLLSAAAAGMKCPFSRDEISEAVRQTVLVNGLESCYIRPLLFFSYGNLGLIPRACPVELIIGAWEMGSFPAEKVEHGLSVYIPAWRRVHHTQFNMAAKLGGIYIQSAAVGLEARRAGFDEAVFLNLEGRIAEGPGQNLFIVRDGVLTTNPRSESVLEGITRTTLLEIAGDLGYSTLVGPITKEAFFDADEAFFCGTAAEVVAIVSVADGSAGAAPAARAIGGGTPGPITRRLSHAYRAAVTGSSARYAKWLTPVDALRAGLLPELTAVGV